MFEITEQILGCSGKENFNMTIRDEAITSETKIQHNFES